MTSPNTGLRRTALVVLAVGAALGASACSAGQITQTTTQVAAVDGGQGSAGDLHVNDLVVALPESGQGEARLGLVASYTGYGLSPSVTIESIRIGDVQAQINEPRPLDRGCSLVFSVRAEVDPNPAGDGVCIGQATATIPAGDFSAGTSLPATINFSNGDQIDMQAGVITAVPEAGQYTRPAEYAGQSEGH